MRKLDFCLCVNKDTDQLHSNCEADQRLCFRYTDSIIPPLQSTFSPNFQILAFFYGFADRFVSDLIGNPEDWFSCIMAHFTEFE